MISFSQFINFNLHFLEMIFTFQQKKDENKCNFSFEISEHVIDQWEENVRCAIDNFLIYIN